MIKRLFVIIDDGHGQNTPGKSSPVFDKETLIGDSLIASGGRFRENTFNMAVAGFLEKELNTYNIPCRQLVPEHDDVSLQERVRRQRELYTEFSKKGFQIVTISIHANAYHPTSKVEFTAAHGIETFYRVREGELKYNEISKKLAQLIQDKTLEICNQRDRGIKDSPQFYILRNSWGPVVLYEGGFMTNKYELEMLASTAYQRYTAKSIREAVVELQGTTHIGNLDPKQTRKV